MKTALVFGASGLTGTFLLRVLLDNPEYARVIAFARRPLNIKHDKLEILHAELDDRSAIQVLAKGDELFCCLGTTIRKAGSQENFRTVDHDYPLMLAGIAKRNGIGTFVLVSSLGANVHSKNFYLRIKGETEEAICKVGINRVIIVRPSMLLGHRQEFRLGERIGRGLMQMVGPALGGRFRKYRAIHSRTVAQALVKLAATTGPGEHVFESDTLKAWANA